MKIVERYRQRPLTKIIRHESDAERLERQLRRATERNHTMFDQGFQAAVRMLEAGADLKRLKEASGVVATECADTDPIFLDESPTLVDAEPCF